MIGRNSAVLTTCLILFPLLGGTLTDVASWRAPFAVYPLGLVTAVLVARFLPRSARRRMEGSGSSFGTCARRWASRASPGRWPPAA